MRKPESNTKHPGNSKVFGRLTCKTIRDSDLPLNSKQNEPQKLEFRAVGLYIGFSSTLGLAAQA